MNNKVQPYSQIELENILLWRENKITPQSIFSLQAFGNNPADDKIKTILAKIFHMAAETCPYDKDAVMKEYRTLQIKSHPDKYRNTGYEETAREVFQLIAEAKEYLLYTIDSDHALSDSNIFFAYYHLDVIPGTTPQAKFDNIAKQMFELKQQGLGTTHQISALCELIEVNPALIHHTRDSQNDSYDLAGKNVFYFSVQWDEPELLDWLLTRFPADTNILMKTDFEVSPLDYAVRFMRIDILRIMQKHYGKDWLKEQLETYLCSEAYDKTKLLTCYEALLPELLDNPPPLLLAASIKTGKTSDPDSTKLKHAIIGCPKLYTTLDESLRQDPYMLVAFLAQKPDEAWLHAIPLRQLDPKFAIALADRWPVLKESLAAALHRDEPPYPNYCNYEGFQKACLAVLIGISLALLTWHFLPIIALSPKFLVPLVLFSTFCLVPLCVILGSMAIGSYTYAIYPEARKISALLHRNHFFAPPPAGVASQSPNQMEATTSLLSFLPNFGP